MARDLLRAYPLMVYDVDHRAVDALVAEGAVAGESPRNVTEATEVLVTGDCPSCAARLVSPNDAAVVVRNPRPLAGERRSPEPRTWADQTPRRFDPAAGAYVTPNRGVTRLSLGLRAHRRGTYR
jgi:hypothetical protein